MGAWGAANGIGQAVGPPIGGLVADAFGWRAIFGALVPVTIGVLVLDPAGRPPGQRPQHPDRRRGRRHAHRRRGAADDRRDRRPAARRPGWLPVVGVVLGVASLVGFVVAGLRSAAPFIDPRLLVEIRWLRSATGVFVQQTTPRAPCWWRCRCT